ncbi:UDP-N-acetyl-D-mannosaminuronic acid dehydrogenase [Sinorhizobium kostiense]|uniref:UDP-N-acetyl-D-mannosaminuronic acid dehydrogenase n=1 Tax=Sinorhizobium kostiense TaxID=76747 RepID=A0ABS4QSR0_9HYPH|nr:UDP-N-acetyl-D-mannosamine dehydrogenase [Sinorhizobium kostiense]MBP2233688.1 UDP-N-acetyl-D-mannosaminuronic acid dehydrogenase [Sinorhizobium kostiense]
MASKWLNNTISVVGLGYIGLPSAAVFAARGVKVIGVDISQRAVDIINSGGVHIVEPDLDIVVRATVTDGRLRAVTVPEPADAFLIAVPTPFKDDHEPDLSFIESACKAIAPVLKRGDLVILESTSPVGTTEKVSKWLAEARADLSFPHEHGENSDIRVAHCPERVLPGHVLRELVENDRIVGGITAKCSAAAVELYKVFVEGECLITNARTAEMCKLTENASRDVAIAFANELSVICEKLGIDVWELIRLANRHPRVNILQPGPGVGGHCIAVDPWFIVHSAPSAAPLIRTARLVNDEKPNWVERKILDAVFAVEQVKGRGSAIIACVGLAFKANIDDLRESPSLEITTRLAQRFTNRVIAVEPNIEELPEDLAALGVRLEDQDTALEQADVVAVLVDHREFIEQVPEIREGVAVIDTKGIWRRLS